MNSTMFFSITSLFYIILLTVVYFSKKRLNNLENKIYAGLIVINLAGVIIEIGCLIVSYFVNQLPFLNYLIPKMFLVYLLTWISLFAFYIYTVSLSNSKNDEMTNKKIKKMFQMFTIIYGISLLFICILPIEYHYNKGAKVYSYTYGSSVNYISFISLVAFVFSVISMLKNIRKIKIQKYYPLLIFVLLGTTVLVIQSINPSMLLVTSAETFVTFLMYFTIENPDLKMIEELNIARDQADKANNAKTEFLSNMSHEIRTPLNAITGFSQALSEENNLPESAKEDVKDILMASDSLLEIVNGILDISKIEANKLEIINTYYNPHKVFKELAVLTKVRLGSDKPIDLRIDIDETIPKSLYGDYARLKQIVLNILTNAVKYTNEGYIEFKVSHLNKDGICRLIISVEDSGIGIKRDKIDKLFNKFERADEERNITIEGTGLGLAITKRLVQLMNGQLVVQSLYGKGSKFTVSIDQRIAIDPNKMDDTASIETLENNKDEVNIKNKKVLVVDDNKLNIKVATRLLEGYGIVVDSAMSGFEAIEKIEAGNTYDLILMDDMMPKMTGTQTLQKLKEKDTYKIPTIALTANAIAGMKENYLANGFDDYLAKPIERKELDRVINKYLNTD